MKYAVATAGAAAMAFAANSAAANGHDEQCYDKGTLSYFDCPTVDEDAWYVGARGGVVFADTEFEFIDGGGAETIDFESDPGYLISAMVGYNFANVASGVSLRPELEIGYLSADHDNIDFNGEAEDDVIGDASVLFGFANLFVDIEVLSDLDLIVGGGVGLGDVELDIVEGFEDGDIAFGYNVGAGLALDVAEGVKVEGMYRYISFVDADLLEGVVDDGSADLDAHTGTIGVRVEL